MPQEFDAIIIGAGAAGMFCAATAGQRGRKVLLVDHRPEPGAKIIISGGGRCNFTNIGAGPGNYLSANPHFAKSALGRYTPQDFIDLVDRFGIAWHEKTLGQLFCDGPSRQIVDLLMTECREAGVTFAFGDAATIEQRDGRFEVAIGAQKTRVAQLVLASGGLSIPKLGATSFAYDTARRFGLKIVEPRPALVPLTLPGTEALFRDLSGVSSDVVAKNDRAAFREAALFTHKGLSGPSILQISSYWKNGEAVGIDFFPDRPTGWLRDAKRDTQKATLANLLSRSLPDRLAAALAERLALAGPLQGLGDKALDAAEAQLRDWRFVPNGSEGFAKAEVTVGGISTGELSSKTMEAKRRPGLFAIGEAVDVTGWLGGYNFQWAWASAHACGSAL